MDYLLFGNAPDQTVLHNTRLLARFKAVQDLPEHDQDAIIAVLDGMIVKHRVQGAMTPMDKPPKKAVGS